MIFKKSLIVFFDENGLYKQKLLSGIKVQDLIWLNNNRLIACLVW